MTHEATLTTLARYKALQYAKAAHRHAGRKLTGMSAAQLRIDAEAWLDHPDVVEWAQRAAETTLDKSKT
jgi:hypothetical protein